LQILREAQEAQEAQGRVPAPLLVFGWRNASRGDDAQGPLFVQRLPELPGAAQRGRVEWLENCARLGGRNL